MKEWNVGVMVLELILKMSEYILPKLKAIETTFNTEDGVQSIKIEVVKSNDDVPHNSL
jgi:hypothetical protein